MRMGQIGYEIEKCERHLDSTGTSNTEVESYFVGYLLIRICSEFESKIGSLIRKRCARIKDKHVVRYSHSTIQLHLRSYKISDLTGLCGRFGEDYKKSF